jgi:hypothetical protein
MNVRDALTELSFEQLGLREELMRGVAEVGFKRCTPIQARTLPIALPVETSPVRRRLNGKDGRFPPRSDATSTNRSPGTNDARRSRARSCWR